jgi:hypothetical protein
VAIQPIGILLISDDRLTREKMHSLARGVALLRQGDCAVEVLPGGTKEEAVIERLVAGSNPQPIHLVLAPWHQYLKWNRLEGHLGLTRTGGPTLAGYLAETTTWKEIPPGRDVPRLTLLDLAQLDPIEWSRVVRAAAAEGLRSGVAPLLAPQAPLYAETWMNGTPLGPRLDALALLAEVKNSPEWTKRLPSARILLSSLWSLIFEEGSGKSDFHLPPKVPKATFQCGIDARAWIFRLCFPSPQLAQSEILGRFWPTPEEPLALPQLLLKYSDLLRVHWVPENHAVEITAGLFHSAPSVARAHTVRTLWLDPIAGFEANEPKAKPFPAVAAGTPPARAPEGPAKPDTSEKIRELSAMIRERDEIIRELRAGGVGSAPPMPPPDTEAILETFRFRFDEAEQELIHLEAAVAQAEQQGVSGPKLAVLKKRIAELTEREKDWVRTIAQTLERFKARRAAGGGR